MRLEGQQPRASHLLDDARCGLHLTEPIDLAVDVVVADTIDEPDAAHLRANLDRRLSTPEFEVRDDRRHACWPLVVTASRVLERAVEPDGLYRHAHLA
jgi:hypothetical protein